MGGIRTELQAPVVRIANREGPDQTSSSGVCAVCLGLLDWQLVLEIFEHLL